jgi:hypothetical protein
VVLVETVGLAEQIVMISLVLAFATVALIKRRFLVQLMAGVFDGIFGVDEERRESIAKYLPGFLAFFWFLCFLALLAMVLTAVR